VSQERDAEEQGVTLATAGKCRPAHRRERVVSGERQLSGIRGPPQATASHERSVRAAGRDLGRSLGDRKLSAAR
jgi:hypothetical protein